MSKKKSYRQALPSPKHQPISETPRRPHPPRREPGRLHKGDHARAWLLARSDGQPDSRWVRYRPCAQPGQERPGGGGARAHNTRDAMCSLSIPMLNADRRDPPPFAAPSRTITMRSRTARQSGRHPRRGQGGVPGGVGHARIAYLPFGKHGDLQPGEARETHVSHQRALCGRIRTVRPLPR